MKHQLESLANKLHLAPVLGIILTFLTPIIPMLIIMGVAIMLDTFSGLWRSKKLNVKLTSHKAWNLASKMLVYKGAVILMYCIEKFIISDLVGIFVDVNLFLTKLVCCVLLFVEIKSMNENYTAVTGVDLFLKLKDLVLKVNKLKKELKY